MVGRPGEIFAEEGVYAGVVDVLFADEAGAWADNPRVDRVEIAGVVDKVDPVAFVGIRGPTRRLFAEGRGGPGEAGVFQLIRENLAPGIAKAGGLEGEAIIPRKDGAVVAGEIA